MKISDRFLSEGTYSGKMVCFWTSLRYYDFDRIVRKELNEKAWYPYRDSKVEVEEELTLDNSNTGDGRFECTTGMDFDMEINGKQC